MKIELTEETRGLVLTRDRHQCIECGSKENLNIHHVIPEKWGGKNIPSNLVTLCRMCHSNRHIEYQTKYFADIIFRMNNLFRSVLQLPEKRDLKKILYLLTKKTTFRPYQKEIIESVLNGSDVLVVMPTGLGKSLCFQLPGVILENQTMVITPLKSLMKDQVEGLWKKKIPATFINSDLDYDEKENRLNLFAKKLFHFIYVAPEQFYDKYQDNKIKINHPLLKNKIDLLVIDEAHCIDKWGRSFRPSYSQLKELRMALTSPRSIALTASASKRVQKNIINSLGMVDPAVFVIGFYRSEIELFVKTFVGKKEIVDEGKINFILAVIEKYKNEKIIIFVPTVKIGRLVWKELIKKDIESEFFCSKQKTEDKIRIQDEYKGTVPSKLKVLICTSAFGMGIDIPNIRIAIHWCITQNIEDYYQQIGRIGRDGEKSKAILLYGDGDVGLIRYINEKSLQSSKKKLTEEEKIEIRNIEEKELDNMLGYIKSSDKWRYILNYFGETKINSNLSEINYKKVILIFFGLIIAGSISVYLFWAVVLIVTGWHLSKK